MADWRGISITPGSHVIYPGRGGDAHWVTEAVVTGFTEHGRLRVRRLRQLIHSRELGSRTVSAFLAPETVIDTHMVTVIYPTREEPQ